MKRFFFSLLLILISLIFVSCGENLSTVNPGLYEINFNLKYADQALIIKQRIRYNPDGTYWATNFKNNTAINEFKGKYKVEQNKLVFYDNQQRKYIRNADWTQKEQSIMKIRRIKTERYQCYLKYPDAQISEEYKEIGLPEGWKTYKRISN